MRQCKQRQRGQQFGVVGTPSPEQRVKAGEVSHIVMQGLCYHGKNFKLHPEGNGVIRVLS